MSKNRSSISKAKSHKEISEFWAHNDLADYWDQTELAEFEVDIQSEVTYYAVDKELAAKVQVIAKQRGISADTLLNLWLQEKVKENKN